MRMKFHGFNATCHSWSIVSQNIARQCKNLGHEIEIFSTNGNSKFPVDLDPYLVGYYEENTDKKTILKGSLPNGEFDLQFSFTALKNAPIYFQNGTKNRYLMWSYEWSGINTLPPGFAKCHVHVDKVLTISTHAKDIFVKSGIPEDKIHIIPCGVDDSFINGTSIYPLKTNKKFKFLSNIAQPHMRKNFPGILEAWGKAFTKKDDVVLVMKIVKKPPQFPFEIDVDVEVSKFKKKYPNHADILFVHEFIEDISSLYRACDCLLNFSIAENFHLPSLEMLLSNGVVICPTWGGHTDHCTDKNTLMVNGKIDRVDPRSMYWSGHNSAFGFFIDVEHAIQHMRYVVNHKQELLEKFIPNTIGYAEKYNWKTIANQMLSLVE
jgi:glycosyltransferase involved in cell wall biosynthesis